jgi:hypothetical protein
MEKFGLDIDRASQLLFLLRASQEETRSEEARRQIRRFIAYALKSKSLIYRIQNYPLYQGFLDFCARKMKF